MNELFIFLRLVVLRMIRVYQRIFSLDHGIFRFLRPYGQCKFHPTCSQYAYTAVEKYGLTRGGWMAMRRVVRCTPWAQGGIDEVK